MEYSAEVVAIGDQIAALSPSKAGDLLAYMKETYNIEPAFGPPTQGPPPPPKEEKQPEKTEFSVVLTGYDDTKRIGLTKTYREVSGRGLKESMEAIVASATTALIVKAGIPKDEADKLKALLESQGGKVELQ